MKTLPVITIPNPNLRQRSLEIADFKNQLVQDLIPVMKETMLKEDGIGLAAPQIGHNIRLICVQEADGPAVYFNPVISKYSVWQASYEEGCLSVPGVYGLVRRPKSIVVTYTKENGETVKEKVEGLRGRIFQHEVDHLDGVLFIDKVYRFTKGQELLPR